MVDMKEQEWLCPLRPEDIRPYLNWVAQDQNGEWCGYEDEPVVDLEFCVWTDSQDSIQPGGEYLCTGEYNANWRNTVQKIPR